jgi:hypothetical protein
LFHRRIHFIELIGISPGTKDRPPNGAFEDDRDRDHQDGDNRIHDDAALKEVLE